MLKIALCVQSIKLLFIFLAKGGNSAWWCGLARGKDCPQSCHDSHFYFTHISSFVLCLPPKGTLMGSRRIGQAVADSRDSAVSDDSQQDHPGSVWPSRSFHGGWSKWLRKPSREKPHPQCAWLSCHLLHPQESCLPRWDSGELATAWPIFLEPIGEGRDSGGGSKWLKKSLRAGMEGDPGRQEECWSTHRV